MAEKFSVKHDGKEIWAGMAMTEKEAIACAGLTNKGIPKEEMTVEIVSFTDERLARITSEDGQSSIATGANTLIKTRKPRADKGQPRKSIPQKETKGHRYLVAENVKICNSRAELENYLAQGIVGNIRIFNYFHEFKAKSQFKYKLEII